jgi:predicted outer membrane protein
MKIKITVVTMATLLTVGSLRAQQDPPVEPKGSVPQVTQSLPTDHALTKEQVFTRCLLITNQEEVSIAKFAKEKSTSEVVKALATTLEKSHQEGITELKALAAKVAANKKATDPTLQVPKRDAYAVDFLQMHQEMSDQCLKDSKEALSKKEGAEFDECFIAMQIAKHGMMHSSLTVLQRHTTGELQGFIKASLAKNDEHMKAASGLMEQMTDKGVVRTAKAK